MQYGGLPPLLRDQLVPGAGWVSAQRIRLAPGKPIAVWETLLAHAPFNEPTRFGVAPTSVGTLRFTPLGSQAPTVAATAGCMVDTITVNGRQQPLLWDTDGGLAAMARKLLGRV